MNAMYLAPQMVQYPMGLKLEEGFIYNVDMDVNKSGEKEVYVKLAKNLFSHLVKNIFLHDEEVYHEEYNEEKLYTTLTLVDSLNKWIEKKETRDELDEFVNEINLVIDSFYNKLTIASNDNIIPNGLYDTFNLILRSYKDNMMNFYSQRAAEIEAGLLSESIEEKEDRLLLYIDNLFLYDTVVKE